MKYDIKEIAHADVAMWARDCRRAGLTFCKSARLFGVFDGGNLIAFTGIVALKNKAIFKNHYVPPVFRGRGIFKIMLSFSIAFASALGVRVVEATCTDMSVREYLKRGFTAVKKYNHFTKVRHENIQQENRP